MALLPILAWCAAPHAASGVISEQQIKAAFIYNFTKFIEWPAERFSGPQDPIVVGVLGESPITSQLTTIVQNRTAGGRSLLVRSVQSAAEANATHVLFVAATEVPRFAVIKDALDHGSMLLVAEADSCAQTQANICFVKRGDKLGFEIHAGDPDRVRVKISSHLRKLATNVRDSL